MAYEMSDEKWARQISGEGCVFCKEAPMGLPWLRHVADLRVSGLWLGEKQLFPGRCVLIWGGRHVTRISELAPEEFSELSLDLRDATMAIEGTVNPDHMNSAWLGNQLAHLHCHVIPRFVGDPRWGGPPWTTDPSELDSGSVSREREDLICEGIRARLTRNGKVGGI